MILHMRRPDPLLSVVGIDFDSDGSYHVIECSVVAPTVDETLRVLINGVDEVSIHPMDSRISFGNWAEDFGNGATKTKILGVFFDGFRDEHNMTEIRCESLRYGRAISMTLNLRPYAFRHVNTSKSIPSSYYFVVKLNFMRDLKCNRLFSTEIFCESQF